MLHYTVGNPSARAEGGRISRANDSYSALLLQKVPGEL